MLYTQLGVIFILEFQFKLHVASRNFTTEGFDTCQNKVQLWKGVRQEVDLNILTYQIPKRNQL